MASHYEKKFLETKTALLVLLVLGITLPFHIFAQIPSSTNYRLEDSQFDSGGGASTSTNYQTTGSIGAEGASKSTSTNYNLFPGYVLPAYPGVPTAPTLTNTGGTLYNALDFVVTTGGNAVGTNYAIAISSDNFITTNYVQADTFVATTTTWQSYSAWGSGTGQRIHGLLPNTAYKIKVKARFGPDSETGFSSSASASTVNPSLTVTISGLVSGTAIGTFTTNTDTTATSVPFGILQNGSIKLGGQKITVTTNAVAGYTTTLQQDNDLTKTNGTQIPAVVATNDAPAAWPSGITQARFGYHTTDSTLCTGTAGRFSADDTFAAATSTPLEVSCNTGPVSSEITNLVFKVEIGALQAAGVYQNKITYITTAQY